MSNHPSVAPAHDFVSATLSAIVPGLGQAVRGYFTQALITFATGIFLVGGVLALWWVTGATSAIFIFMLLVLPWWALQSYCAGLADPKSLRQALAIAWTQAHDIRYLGALFFLTAFTDLYIIVANPEYALTIFCSKPGGVLGILAKVQSPTLHILIGYGFMHLRRWSLFLYMAYAAFGLLNATSNFACFGYGRVRTAFLLTLVGFTLYVIWRHRRFST